VIAGESFGESYERCGSRTIFPARRKEEGEGEGEGKGRDRLGLPRYRLDLFALLFTPFVTPLLFRRSLLLLPLPRNTRHFFSPSLPPSLPPSVFSCRVSLSRCMHDVSTLIEIIVNRCFPNFNLQRVAVIFRETLLRKRTLTLMRNFILSRLFRRKSLCFSIVPCRSRVIPPAPAGSRSKRTRRLDESLAERNNVTDETNRFRRQSLTCGSSFRETVISIAISNVHFRY